MGVREGSWDWLPLILLTYLVKAFRVSYKVRRFEHHSLNCNTHGRARVDPLRCHCELCFRGRGVQPVYVTGSAPAAIVELERSNQGQSGTGKG